MPHYTITNMTMQRDLAIAATIAANPWQRFVGLLGRKTLPTGEGLVLRGCTGIHMLGMRFPVDALYVDAQNIVIHAISRLAPWRIGPLDPTAAYVVELPAGALEATGTSVGDSIKIRQS